MSEKISVLYVDDEPDLLAIAKIFLERLGDFTLTTIPGALQAIDLLNTESFDIIISDYQMPKMDGIVFLNHLKKSGNQTPFILFTGKGREEVVIEALNGGADFYLQKGGDAKAQFTELASIIRSTVSKNRTEQELQKKSFELQAAYEQMTASDEELRANLEELIHQESVIRIHQERLIMAQEISKTGCWEYNLQTNTIWGSAEGLGIFGYPPIAGNFPIDEIEACIPERERVHQALVDLLTERRPYDLEYAINPADGTAPKYIHSVARLETDAQGSIIRVMGIIQDITERKRGEQVLQETNEAFVLAQKIARIGSWMYDLRTDTITWSDELYRVFGHEPGSPLLKPDIIRTAFHPEDLEKHNTILKKAIETAVYEPEEYRVMYPDGSLHYVMANGTVDVDDKGKAVRVIGVFQDITELKLTIQERERLIAELGANNEELSATYEELLGTEQELKSQYNTLAVSEENLRQTKDFLENLITIANVPIIVWDPELTIIKANKAFELLIGRPVDDVIGKSLKMLFPLDHADHSIRLLQISLEGDRSEPIEITIQRADGSLRSVLWNSSVLYTADGTIPVATIAQGQDITTHKRLERERDIALAQIKQNLAQLSILNDGIRNPLMVITLSADTLSDTAAADQIIRQTQHIDDMIRQLDQRWIESEKVLDFLRKHYQVSF